MTEDEWNQSLDPIPMLWYLASRGCTNDFANFETEIGNRIRPEVSDPLLIMVLDGDCSHETQIDLQDRMVELGEQAAQFELGSEEAQEIYRQIEIGESLLVFGGHGFAETATDFSQAMAGLFLNADEENAWQASVIRDKFTYDYSPTDT